MHCAALCLHVQVNALKAICPATLDVLLTVLAGGITSGPSSVQREEFARLKDVVLSCVVHMVRLLHTCNPEEVGADSLPLPQSHTAPPIGAGLCTAQ